MIGQLFAVVRKEFKLLMRSKSSTLAVLFGPLILVLLVGLVFTNANTPDLVVGLVEEDFENSDVYAKSLRGAFTIIEFSDPETCSNSVKQAQTVSCVVLEAGSPPTARVFVDPSDVNVVYAVIDQITGNIEEESSALRSGLTGSLLSTVSSTGLQLTADHEQLTQARLAIEQQGSRADEMSSELRDVRIDIQLVTVAEVAQAIDASVNARDDYQLVAEELLTDYKNFVNLQADQSNPQTGRLGEIDDYTTRLDDIGERSNGHSESIFAQLLSSLQGLDDEIASSEAAAQALSAQANQVKNSLTSAEKDIDAVLASLARSRNTLTGLDISETDITSPISPVIEPVTTQDDNLGFVFPYFLVLIVMFTSILLASQIIVRERNSQAYFRNFATPTKDWIFVVATYLTTLVVLIMQLFIIYVAAAFFLTLDLSSSIGATALLLLLVITFFTLLGMLIGYAFKTHEAVMLAGIAIAALLLFISGLVLPLQTLPPLIKFIVGANPFVLSAELLKATMIFNFGVGDIITLFGVLLLYSVIMFTAIIIVQRISRVRYFELAEAPERIKEFLGLEEIPEGKELMLKNRKINTKKDLLAALRAMKDEEYEQYATHNKNLIADWISDVYKDDKLSRSLRNKSRKGAISILEKER